MAFWKKIPVKPKLDPKVKKAIVRVGKGRGFASLSWRPLSSLIVLPKIPAKLRIVRILESPFSGKNPTKTGIFKTYAISQEVVTVVACVAMAIVMHLVVYLGIDVGSLSMPAR